MDCLDWTYVEPKKACGRLTFSFSMTPHHLDCLHLYAGVQTTVRSWRCRYLTKNRRVLEALLQKKVRLDRPKMFVSKRGDKAQIHRAFLDRIENMLSHTSIWTHTAPDMYLIYLL